MHTARDAAQGLTLMRAGIEETMASGFAKDALMKKRRKKMPTINNLPDYYSDYEYIVARDIEGELWYWGAYHDQDRANNIAEDINGVVVEVEV